MKIASLIFLSIGIVMFLKSSRIGNIFSKLGEIIFRNSPFPEFEKFYREQEKINTGIKVIGIIFMLQSPFLFIISFLFD